MHSQFGITDVVLPAPEVYEDFQAKAINARRMAPKAMAAMKEIIDDLVDKGLIYRNPNAWSVSPAWAVPKPSGKGWRMVCDLRHVNSGTRPISINMPDVDYVLRRLAGRSHYYSLDMASGYWQLPLDPDTAHMFSFSTPFGTYTPRSTLQGARNSGANFQQAMSTVLDNIPDVYLWLDDIVAGYHSEEAYLDALAEVFARCAAHNVYLNPRKCELHRTSVEWTGRVIDHDGWRFNDGYLTGLANMPEPTSAGDLLQWLASANWIRGSIPEYAKLVAPLQALLNDALRGLPDRRKSTAKKVALTDAGWTDEHSRAYRDLKRAIEHSVTLAAPKPDHRRCVFTDASASHWSGLVTQIPLSDVGKPVPQQQHQLLGCVSGPFTPPALAWSILEKEAYAVVETITKHDYILLNSDSFDVYTDCRNLVYLYAPSVVNSSVRRFTSQKLERWAMQLGGYTYTIHHIAGDDNVWPDLMTRWGHAPTTSSAMPRVHARCAKRKDTANTKSASAARTVRPYAPHDFDFPSAVDIHNMQLSVLLEGGAMPSKITHIGTDSVRHRVDDKATTTLEADESLLLRTSDGQVWIPDADHLPLRVFIAAHAGSNGHRGGRATTDEIKKRFWWPTLAKDVTGWVNTCLHCLPTRGGTRVPRPLGQAVHGDKPNAVLHFDFVYIRAVPKNATHNNKWVLVLKDDFSRWVELVATPNADACTAATAVIDWMKRFGAAPIWVSDRGSHFKNQVMAEIAERMLVDHHFTTAHIHYNNGTVERVMSELKATLTALLRETKLAREEWPRLLPAVQAALNQAPREGLGGHCATEVFTGLRPMRAVDVILRDSVPSDVSVHPVSAERVAEHTSSLRTALDAIHQGVVNNDKRSHKSSSTPRKSPNWQVGDFVLVARVGADARDKTRARWIGPMRVVAALSEHVYSVQDLITEDVHDIHADRLRFYSDKHLAMTEELNNLLAYQSGGYLVDAIAGHRNVDGEWSFLVKWKGFEEAETTYEPAMQLYEDVPVLVRKYVKDLGSDSADADALRLLLDI
jgi:hypothetical protein